ncbi:hypothetical protein ACQ4PT_060815 [Festuca glaucescens]
MGGGSVVSPCSNPNGMASHTDCRYAAIETDLIFAGLAGLRDPPREEVFDAMEDCRVVGIRVMVITGDNKETAEAICHEIGVFSPDEDISLKCFTGKEFMALEDQKTLLRRKGGLLFSGDGINDVPALKLANISNAMDITGTEVFENNPMRLHESINVLESTISRDRRQQGFASSSPTPNQRPRWLFVVFSCLHGVTWVVAVADLKWNLGCHLTEDCCLRATSGGTFTAGLSSSIVSKL